MSIIKRMTGLLLRYGAMTALWLWAALSLASLAWLFLSSLKTNREVLRSGLAIPAELHWENFARAWTVGRLGQYALNSLIVTSLAVVLLLAVCAPAAYVLTRSRIPGREVYKTIYLLGMGIPVPLLFIPLFSILVTLRLHDSLIGLALVYVATSIPFTIYVLTGFFSTIPKELEQAAVMEGCTPFQVFWRVMLPLARPGLVAAALFNFVWLWNEYQLSLVVLTSGDNRTLVLGVYALQNAMQYSGDWTGLFAGITIVVLPTLFLYAVMSEKMIAGMTAGAVK